MKKLNILVAAMLMAGASFAQTWTSDKAHSKLGFDVTHLMVTEVEGAFKSFDVKVTSAKDDFSDAVVELTADPATISTDNDNRDNHLKSPDFFDVAKFNTLSFKSTSFKKVEDKKYKLVGDLTLHGVTKPVELEVTLNGTGTNMAKKTVAGFKVSGKFKRTDFGVGQSGGAVVGEEIHLRANIELVKG